MPPSPASLWLLLLLLSLPLLVQLLYGRQRRAVGHRWWAAVGVAAMGDGARRVMVMGGARRRGVEVWRGSVHTHSHLCVQE